TSFNSSKRTSAVRAALRPSRQTTPRGWSGWHVLTDCFNAGFAPAAGLVVAGVVGWAFVWPHLAWQIASRAVDPLSREIYNLKTDAVLAGMWVGVMGVNVLPSTAMLMIMCLNLMGAGGPRLFV
ncbi:MASE2 domain-containing protein, partial [Pseudomonas aeruginosa]